MKQFLQVLREIASLNDTFIAQKDTVVFSRAGVDWELKIKLDSELGWLVHSSNNEEVLTPLDEYVKNDILGLDKLAVQVAKYYNRRAKGRNPIISAPIQQANMLGQGRYIESTDGVLTLCNLVKDPLPFETRMVFLMAKAGQGKTALLDKTSEILCNAYSRTSVAPILINVDLLGRFIGTFDDAIAGTLNNTFEYPSLRQSDVVACLKENWLALALDGFDELVSRVGARDAFQKLSDLISQLNGRGTLILSARDNFFELPSIKRDIQKYLNPARGDFELSEIKLCNWRREQQLKYVYETVMKNSSVEDPIQVTDCIIDFFGDKDSDLVSSPFFFSKVCELWFSKLLVQKSVGESTNKIHYVINSYILREAKEKWISKDGAPLIPIEYHELLLSDIAVVFWKSNSGKIPVEDLELYALVSVDELKLPVNQLDELRAKAPTHAVFSNHNGLVSFSHVQFHNYYLANAIVRAMFRLDKLELDSIVSVAELMPEVIEWIGFWVEQRNALGLNFGELIRMLSGSAGAAKDFTIQVNVAALASKLFDYAADEKVVLSNAIFVGENLECDRISSITFNECTFTSVSFDGIKFQDVEFTGCVFSGLYLGDTDLSGVTLDSNCRVESINTDADGDHVGSAHYPIFDQSEIVRLLKEHGAKIMGDSDSNLQTMIELPEATKFCVHRMLKKANQHVMFSPEEIDEEEAIQVDIRKVCSIGVETGVLKPCTSRAVGGKSRTFYRFIVDREKVRDGLFVLTGDKIVDRFVKELSAKIK